MWDPSPLVLAAALVATLRFAQAFVRLRRRGRTDHAGWDRAALFAAGLALATLPLVSPLGAAAETLLSAHMLEHVLIADAAPALLLVAVRGPLLFFMLPAAVVRLVTRRAILLRLVSLAGRPMVALGAWAGVYALWHLQRAHELALGNPVAHHVEHASFVLVGFLVWTQIVDPARHRTLSVTGRLAFVGVLFALGQLLSDVLLLAPAPLFPGYAEAGTPLFGLSPLADQQLAALVMMAEQLLVLGTCAALLVCSCVRGGTPRRAAAAPAAA